MAAAVPFELGESGSTAWQICDIATDPQFRSRGLFAGCLAALGEAVGSDMMFCFPNKQSRTGLIRAGFAVQAVLRVVARPVWGLAARGPQALRAGQARPADGEPAIRADSARRLHLRRSPDFLAWRYERHPLNRYVALLEADGGVDSCVVVRRALNDRVGLVVENWSGSAHAARTAREAALRWAAGSGCWGLLSARAARGSPGRDKKAVAAPLLPWDVVCYTRGGTGAAGMAEGLHVQLGDWDAV